MALFLQRNHKNSDCMIKTIKLSKEAWKRMRSERIKEIIDSDWEKIKFLRNSADETLDSQWLYIDEDYINSFKAYDKHVGKYIQMRYLESNFANGLFFQEPSQWNDDFESRFYMADYSNIVPADKITAFTPRLYACCFTYGFETEAAWKTYSGNDSQAKNVVRLELNKRKLFPELNNWAKLNNFTIYVGYVNYTYPLQLLKTIHLANERENSLWFENFTLKNYLSLLLQKRQAYYNEMEERIFIVPDDGSTPVNNTKWVNIPLKEIIDKIILSPEFQPDKEKDLNYLCLKYGIKCKIQRSELNAKKSTCDSTIVIEPVSDRNPWRFCSLR